MIQLLAKQINNIVAQDVVIEAGLKRLSGSEVAIKFGGLDTGFVITIVDSRVSLAKMDFDLEYEATISASVTDFMYIMKNKNKKGFVFPKKLEIAGNGDKAMGLLSFIAGLNLDWERYMAEYIGDGLANIAAKIFNSGVDVLSSVAKNTSYNVADFLTDEIAMVPMQAEVDDFCAGVTTARDDVARLEARMQSLLAEGNKCEQ